MKHHSNGHSKTPLRLRYSPPEDEGDQYSDGPRPHTLREKPDYAALKFAVIVGLVVMGGVGAGLALVKWPFKKAFGKKA